VSRLDDANDPRMGASRHDHQTFIGIDRESLFVQPIP